MQRQEAARPPSRSGQRVTIAQGKVCARVGAFMEEAVMLNNLAPFQTDPMSVGADDAAVYVQTNLVSDVTDLGAKLIDSNLVNPWGVSFIPPSPASALGSPFWISDQGKDLATLYSVHGSTGTDVSPVALTVQIPHIMNPHGPTGQVSNTNLGSFHLDDGISARFIFANLDGTISAWHGAVAPGMPTPTTAEVEATTPGAVYTGLAVNEAHTMLYAADTRGGKIDVFDSNFNPVDLGDLGNHAFRTPGQIEARGLVPFNVTDIGGHVYVTYAPAGRAAQIAAGEGDGAVAIFSESGNLEPHGVLLGGPQTPSRRSVGRRYCSKRFRQVQRRSSGGQFQLPAQRNKRFRSPEPPVGRHDPDLRRFAHAGRSLGPNFRGRPQRRQPEHPLLHRRHRRRDAWSFRSHHERVARWGIGGDAFGRIRIRCRLIDCRLRT
jgi:uncharacterized protein (TIGR03118 family)